MDLYMPFIYIYLYMYNINVRATTLRFILETMNIVYPPPQIKVPPLKVTSVSSYSLVPRSRPCSEIVSFSIRWNYFDAPGPNLSSCVNDCRYVVYGTKTWYGHRLLVTHTSCSTSQATMRCRIILIHFFFFFKLYLQCFKWPFPLIRIRFGF